MIRIEVTKEDIMRGMKKDCFSCPIARAMKRQGFTSVTVGRNQILASHADGSVVDVAAPKKVRVFVSRFDDGQYVEPFSFVLEDQSNAKNSIDR